jgi:hypothetical protein
MNELDFEVFKQEVLELVKKQDCTENLELLRVLTNITKQKLIEDK